MWRETRPCNVGSVQEIDAVDLANEPPFQNAILTTKNSARADDAENFLAEDVRGAGGGGRRAVATERGHGERVEELPRVNPGLPVLRPLRWAARRAVPAQHLCAPSLR